MLDIYFNPEYGKLCELVDGGKWAEYSLSTSSGKITNSFIMRPAPWLLDGKQYYDIVTPYGYGGPIIQEASDKPRLLMEYQRGFQEYCRENAIVCEFIRFHPIYRNYEDFAGIYDVIYSRHTVGTNLQEFDDPVQSEFSKSARKDLRKATGFGVTCSIHKNPDNLIIFKQLYEETMDRNHAEAMYYFPDEYYKILTHELRDSVLEIQAHWNDEIIASEIYFVDGGIMHAHLLGSNHKLLDVCGGVMLEATAARWGKENGYRFIHHGGGRSSAEDDPLYLYKKKFGKHTQFDFYIARKVWQEELYEQLVSERKKEGPIENPEYFPMYRG